MQNLRADSVSKIAVKCQKRVIYYDVKRLAAYFLSFLTQSVYKS